jgi:1,4-dihydroxy-2-naphthoate octaprenyltransferase
VRVAASGLIDLPSLRRGIALTLGLAAIIGFYLTMVGGWPILAIGIAAILATLGYSGGPFPLASHGLGDLAVFIFFGLAAVGGTYWAQALRFDGWVLLAASAPGALITAILIVNNLRDIDTDRKAGKNTLAVVLGRQGTRIEFMLMFVVSYAVPVIMWLAGGFSAWTLLALLTLPLTGPLLHAVYSKQGPALNQTLAGTAQLSFLFSLLFALGLALS